MSCAEGDPTLPESYWEERAVSHLQDCVMCSGLNIQPGGAMHSLTSILVELNILPINALLKVYKKIPRWGNLHIYSRTKLYSAKTRKSRQITQ